MHCQKNKAIEKKTYKGNEVSTHTLLILTLKECKI
jgi:hypothetical protein